MKMPASLWQLVAVLAGSMLSASSTSEGANPLSKVLDLLSNLEREVIKSGDSSHKGFMEFSRMCETRSIELKNEISTGKSEVEDLKATIDKASDDIEERTTEIEELSSTASTAEADLKSASLVRKKEAADFVIDQKDFVETIGQLERAISILEKHKKGTSLVQLPLSVRQQQQQQLKVQAQTSAAFVQAMSAIVDASSVDSADYSKLAALLQTSEDDARDADTAELDAEEDAYTKGTKDSASIIETLQGLLEKAQTQLESAREKETKNRFAYEDFKASLERKLAVANKDMKDAKKAQAEASQTRAGAQGELEKAKKDLDEDKTALGKLHHACMSRATSFQAETKSRDEELKALKAAQKVLKEMTGEAEDQVYGKFAQVTFIQVKSRSRLVASCMEAVNVVRDMINRQATPALVQLLHKMDSVIRQSVISGEDPFKKVKVMLSSMLDQLNKQMQEEADKKAYCDQEMSSTKKSKDAKESAVEKLKTRIDTQTSESMSLKEQVGILQKELVAISQSQKEMDQIRKNERDLYDKSKPEILDGIKGVKKALQVLREYYSQDDEKSQESKDSAASSILGLLEVVESDFDKSLSTLDAEEDSAQSEYDQESRENAKTKAIKEEAVGFKTKQMKGLDKATSESSTDLDGVQTELDAVIEYYTKIQEECVAKAEPYEERRKRQQKTLQGLQDAMQILEGRASLVQQERRSFRGPVVRKRGTDISTEPLAGVETNSEIL